MREIIYIAHIKSDESGEDVFQSVREHCLGTSAVNEEYLRDNRFENTVRIACLLHDAGKYSDEFQTYIRKAHENPDSVRRGEVTHSTAGAQILRDIMKKSVGVNQQFAIMAFELIRHAIISHHGFADCISPDGALAFAERDAAAPLNDAVKFRCFADFDQAEAVKLFSKAADECGGILKDMAAFFAEKANAVFGSKYYFLGMHERFILSCLTDADRTDTAVFCGNSAYADIPDTAADAELWRKMLDNLKRRLSAFSNDTLISRARGEISSECMSKAMCPNGIFRLTVPTGGGKTFASIAFALTHAIHNDMRRIIYVAPYNSILEQNSAELGDALDADEYILEHHCNVINEDDADKERYDVLSQRWNSPIILTSAVQLLNTLFSDKISSVRRFRALENSIIIFDEIQSLPVRCTSLFNLSVNYLTKFCGSSVVLCSATQPPLTGLKNNRMCPAVEIVENYGHYFDIFKRTEIICDIGRDYNAEELADFVMDKAENNLLVIVNTKAAARRLYEALEQVNSREFKLFHLSTNMCAAHRRNVISDVRNCLASGEKCICVSTQLIEAGVDISFERVVRSLSGLDSIVQAGGRCNRHGERGCGEVYVIKYSEEKVSRLRDICIAQQAMENFIYAFESNPQNFGGSMLSPQAMQAYYKIHFRERRGELDYNVGEYHTCLVDLLSMNEHGLNESRRKYRNERQYCLTQAFHTAGRCFEAIENQGNVDVIVPYNEGAEYIEQLRSSCDLGQKYQLLKKLQSYTVSASRYKLEKLGECIERLSDTGILVLDKRGYDDNFGAADELGEMQNLVF